RARVPELADEEAGVRGLGDGDAVEHGPDPVPRRRAVTADVELDERRVPVLRDRAATDVLDDRELRDARDDVADGGVEHGRAGPLRAALDQDALARRLLEPSVQDPVHPAGLTGSRRVRIDLP